MHCYHFGNGKCRVVPVCIFWIGKQPAACISSTTHYVRTFELKVWCMAIGCNSLINSSIMDTDIQYIFFTPCWLHIFTCFSLATLLYHSRKRKKKPTTAHASLFRPVVISLSRIALNKGTKRTTLVKQQEGMPAVWPKETYDFSLIELQR